MQQFTATRLEVPDHDNDIELVFRSGKRILIQCRPSNADVDYNGSLDIILPDNMVVTNWFGDDMQPAPATGVGIHDCERMAKQLVLELP